MIFEDLEVESDSPPSTMAHPSSAIFGTTSNLNTIVESRVECQEQRPKQVRTDVVFIIIHVFCVNGVAFTITHCYCHYYYQYYYCIIIIIKLGLSLMMDYH